MTKKYLTKIYVQRPAGSIKKFLDRVIDESGGAINKVVELSGKLVKVILEDGTTFVVRTVSGTGKLLTSIVFEVVPSGVVKIEESIRRAGGKILAKR